MQIGPKQSQTHPGCVDVHLAKLPNESVLFHFLLKSEVTKRVWVTALSWLVLVKVTDEYSGCLALAGWMIKAF